MNFYIIPQKYKITYLSHNEIKHVTTGYSIKSQFVTFYTDNISHRNE